MISLAYDGSIKGDWISHYAVRMAANDASRHLVVYIRGDDSPPTVMTERLQHIEREYRRVEVDFDPVMLPGGQNPFWCLERAFANVVADCWLEPYLNNFSSEPTAKRSPYGSCSRCWEPVRCRSTFTVWHGAGHP